jgi:hypothetical protein
VNPALAIKISILPGFSIAELNNLSTFPGAEMSQGYFMILLSLISILSIDLDTAIILHWNFFSSLSRARPIPEDAPVIMRFL